MTTDDNKKKLMNFAFEELQKVINDLKNGKQPTFSKNFEKLNATIAEANERLKNNEISEQDVEKIVNDFVSKKKGKK